MDANDIPPAAEGQPVPPNPEPEAPAREVVVEVTKEDANPPLWQRFADRVLADCEKANRPYDETISYTLEQIEEALGQVRFAVQPKLFGGLLRRVKDYIYGSGYTLSSKGHNGKRWDVVTLDKTVLAGDQHQNLARINQVRGVKLYAGVLCNPKAVMAREKRAALEGKLKRAAWRMSQLSGPVSEVNKPSIFQMRALANKEVPNPEDIIEDPET